MDRIWRRIAPRAAYEPLEDEEVNVNAREGRDALVTADEEAPRQKIAPFSWMAYSVFLLLGVAMLWAWYV